MPNAGEPSDAKVSSSVRRGVVRKGRGNPYLAGGLPYFNDNVADPAAAARELGRARGLIISHVY